MRHVASFMSLVDRLSSRMVSAPARIASSTEFQALRFNLDLGFPCPRLSSAAPPPSRRHQRGCGCRFGCRRPGRFMIGAAVRSSRPLEDAKRRRRCFYLERPPVASTNRRVSVATPVMRCIRLESRAFGGQHRPRPCREPRRQRRGTQRSPSLREAASERLSTRIQLTEGLGRDLDAGDDAGRFCQYAACLELGGGAGRFGS